MTASQHPLDLVPGSALGPFRLGPFPQLSSLPTSMSLTQTHSNSLPSIVTGSLLFNVLNHVREYRDTYPHANLAWDEQVRQPVDRLHVGASLSERCAHPSLAMAAED